MSSKQDTQPADPLLGQVFGGTYHILREIDRGGMATIYEASHTRIDRLFAIKVMHYKADAEMMARFEREAMIASRLDHENIVDVIDFNRTAQGEPYLVMELLKGENLAELLRRQERLPLGQALAILRQTASALGTAHHGGVVHRDLKPDNIFLSRRTSGEVQVKVMDFGISKLIHARTILTQGSRVFGTPWYMSPEQAQGLDDVDHRADIYALGVIVYQMLSGSLPFPGNNPPAVLYGVVHEEAPPLTTLCPALEPALVSVVNRAMEKEVKDRFWSADEMVRAAASAVQEQWKVSLAWDSVPEFVDQRIASPQRAPEYQAEKPTDGADETMLRVSGTAGGSAAIPEVSQASATELFSERVAKIPVAITGPGQPIEVATKSSAPRYALAALLLCSIVGGAAFYLWRHSGENKERPIAVAADDASTRDSNHAAKPDLHSPVRPASDSHVPDTKPAAAPSLKVSVQQLSVATQPAGASIHIDGKFVGKSPINSIAISAKGAELRVAKAGYRAIKRTIGPGDKPLQLDVNLKALPTRVNVVALHQGKQIVADVYLNGRKVDQTPAQFNGLKPGTYRMRLQRTGFKNREWQFVLKPGQKEHFAKALRK